MVHESFNLKLALDGIDLDRFDFYAEFLKPSDACFDVVALTLEFERNYAYLVVDAGLADVGDDGEFVAQLVDDGARDELSWEKEPKAGGLACHKMDN